MNRPTAASTSPSAILPRPYQVAHDRARPWLGISGPLLGDRRHTPGDDADRSLRGVLGGQDTRDPAPVPDRRLPSRRRCRDADDRETDQPVPEVIRLAGRERPAVEDPSAAGAPPPWVGEKWRARRAGLPGAPGPPPPRPKPGRGWR